MALTKKDLQQLKEVISTEITDQLSTQLAAQDARFNATLYQQKSELVNAFDQQTQDIKRDIRDEMDARFSASEQRFDKKLTTLREEFAEILSEQLLPSIDRLDTKIDTVHKDLKRDIAGIRFHVGMAT